MLRKTIFLLLAFALCLGLGVVSVSAAEVSYPVTGGSIIFDPNTGTVTGCEDSVTEADIPSEIMGVKVTAIGEKAFFFHSNLTRVTIPSGVTTIGERAFQDCTYLASLSLPSTLVSIEHHAFCDCDRLTSVILPSSVTSMSDSVFAYCNALQTVVLSTGLTEVPEKTFANADALSSVTLPAGITTIGEDAFRGTSALKTIQIPDTVTSIKDFAFYQSGLTTLTVPDSVTSLGRCVFKGSSALESAVLGNGVAVIPYDTLQGCALKTAVVPEGVTTIGESAFGWDSYLKTISLPASLTSVEEYAFAGCEALTDVYFAGTQAQWFALDVADDNQPLSAATIHFNSTGPAPVGPTSSWAVTEVEKAAQLDLIPDVLTGQDLTQPITRAEFAAVSVKVFENLSGGKAVPIVNNPFTDTRDTEVLKAYGIGAVNGTSATTFTPNALLNREQCATMLTRVFKRITLAGWTLANDSQFKLDYVMPARFADDADISDYAKDSVYFMVANKIINGIGNNTFAPKNTTSAQEAKGYANATREQALAIAVRMVENLN